MTFLVDELLARKEAARRRLRFIRTLGILRRAAQLDSKFIFPRRSIGANNFLPRLRSNSVSVGRPCATEEPVSMSAQTVGGPAVVFRSLLHIAASRMT